MIHIDGLTERQCKLLDQMWIKDSHEELYTWVESLPIIDAMEVDVLVEMVQLAYIDKEVNCVSDLSLANTLIEKARNKC